MTFVKTAKINKPRGYVAIDVNEDNVTAMSSDGETRIFNLSKLKKAGLWILREEKESSTKIPKG